MNAPVVVTGVGVAVVLLTLLTTYNGLMHLQQEIRLAWSVLDEQLKQRYELVSTLTVLGQSIGGEVAAKVMSVIAARNQTAIALGPVELAGAEAGLTASLNSLLVVLQENTALKADLRISSIYYRVVVNQKRIDQVCAQYNQKVHALNSALSSFPQGVTAKAMGLRPQPLFNLQC